MNTLLHSHVFSLKLQLRFIFPFPLDLNLIQIFIHKMNEIKVVNL